MGERPTFDFKSRLRTKSVKRNTGEAELAQQQVDLGENRVDSGENRVDSGENRVDSGENKVDSGQQEFFSSQQQVDSGENRVDSGENRVDSGQQEFFSSQQQVDSGENRVDSGNDSQRRGAQKQAIGETLISSEGRVANAENLAIVQSALQNTENLGGSVSQLVDKYQITLEDQNVDDPKQRVLTAEGILGHIESTDPTEIAAANEALFTENMQLQCAKSFCKTWVGAGGPRAEQMNPQSLAKSEWFATFSSILPYFQSPFYQEIVQMGTATNQNTGKYQSLAFDLAMQAAVRKLVFVCDHTGETPQWAVSSYDSPLKIDYQSAKDGKMPKTMSNWVASEEALLQTMQTQQDQNMLAELDQMSDPEKGENQAEAA